MKETKPHTTPLPNSAPSEELYRFGADGNLRLYSYDRLFYALYGYDGGTTRTYKYSMDLSPNWVNGRLKNVSFNLHNAMFYPNSYLNFNSNGYYTKHYYNGMERIASRLGDNNLSLATHDPELQDRKDQLDSNIRRNIVDITGYEFLEPGQEQDPDDPKPVFELPQVGMTNLISNTSSVYYYHTNHLGNTCYVTDGNASVVQGFLYAPFGEITNEYNSGWQSGVLPKYSFNAKELDEETGMYYYEARYMAPPVFISRDPLFEKYPTFSPYAYCVNNPIKFVDPTGEELDIADNEETKRDLRSIVRKENRDRIIFNGMHVSVNTEGLSDKEREKDIGLSLIINMCNSDKKILFETSDYAFMLDENWKNNCGNFFTQNSKGIVNASNFGMDCFGAHMDRPINGYDGQVILSKSGTWVDEYGKEIRESVIFHELAENYYRTHYNYSYHGNLLGLKSAHNSAVLLELNYFNNPQPGRGTYTGFNPSEQQLNEYANKRKEHVGY